MESIPTFVVTKVLIDEHFLKTFFFNKMAFLLFYVYQMSCTKLTHIDIGIDFLVMVDEHFWKSFLFYPL